MANWNAQYKKSKNTSVTAMQKAPANVVTEIQKARRFNLLLKLKSKNKVKMGNAAAAHSFTEMVSQMPLCGLALDPKISVKKKIDE